MVVRSLLNGLPRQFDVEPNCSEDQGDHLQDRALVLPPMGVPSLFRGSVVGDFYHLLQRAEALNA